MTHSTMLLLTVLMMPSQNTQGLAPRGCTYDTGVYTCDFQEWTPPLQDTDFEPGPLYFLNVININGTFPAGAFSGLNGPPTKKQGYLYFNCDNGKTSLSRDIFTENLHWVTQLQILDCYLKVGLPSRLLENLKSLIYFTIRGGEVEGPVEHDTLSGLTNLLEITVRAPIKSGELPYAFFSGLENLTTIQLSRSALDSIPPKWLDGLVSLERIYLGNNNLQTLPLGLFDGLKSLEHVGLNSNPWNCSCELTWLLDWSNITVGAICKEPSSVVNVKLEEALYMLDCSPFPSTMLSASGFSITKITTAEKSFVSIFIASSTLKQANTTITATSRSAEFSTATSLKQKWINSTPTKSVAMPVTSRHIPLISATTTQSTTALTWISTTSSTLRIPTTSMKSATTGKVESTHFLSNISSIISTSSTCAQVRLNNSNTGNNDANGIPTIIIITGVGGAFTALPVTATVIYWCACRKKGIESICWQT